MKKLCIPFMTCFLLKVNLLCCGQYSCNTPFPTYAFSSHPDSSKVYLSPSRIRRSSLKDIGLTDFVSVFGIRVVCDEGVDLKKLVHVGTILAELLDMKESGKPMNPGLVKALEVQNSMIVILSDSNVKRKILSRTERPADLKCFPRAFHIADHRAVKLDTTRELICPLDDGRKDRTKGLVGDFIVSKGYPATYPKNEEIGIRMKQFFETALKNNWIETKTSNCRSRVCAEIAFQSWALSSAMGSDKCWCERANEWKFCTPEAMKRGFPELWGTLADELVSGNQVQPNGRYHSSSTIG